MKREEKRIILALSALIVAVLFLVLEPTTEAGKEELATATGQATQGEASFQLISSEAEENATAYEPDVAEVEGLAKMLYGEARGVASTTEQAACVWCVLNRVDDPRFPDTVLEVLEAPYQFAGYDPRNPATDELKALAADVLTRYHAERDGETNVGRVLPAEYVFFTGDGKRNYFTIGWQEKQVWHWGLESPYAN